MKIFYALAAVVLLTACKGNGDANDEDKNVDLPSNIIAAVYSKAAMDSLLAKINAIPELTEDLKNAKLSRVAEDSLALEQVVTQALKGSIPFDKGYEQGKFILITSNQNAAKLHEGEMNEYGYNLTSIDTTYPPRPFQDIELWRYHYGKYSDAPFNDSVSTFYANMLKESLEKEPAIIKKVKYLVSVCDILLVEPEVVDDKTFKGGVLMFEIKVYDANTGAKVAQDVIMAKNSDSATNFMDSNLGKTMQDDVLYEDLLKNKDKEILNFLENKKEDVGSAKSQKKRHKIFDK